MIRSIVIGATFVLSVLALAGQSSRADVGVMPRPAPTPENVVFKDYKGITIGMATQAVREKLGNPKEKADAMDFYLFSDDESAQFFYGEDKSVTAITITYAGDLKRAPTPVAVFGQEVEAGTDGGIFKMARYPKAGFWIAYTRTAGDDAIISIAMQKL